MLSHIEIINKPENNFACDLMYILALSRMLTYSVENKRLMVGHSHVAKLEEKSKVYKWVWLQMAAEIAHLQGPA